MPAMNNAKSRLIGAMVATSFAAMPLAAQAGLILSQAVVDITPGAPVAQDIEVTNDSDEIAYVVAQPFEIVAPGLPAERREAVIDPATGGLLVTPQKMILQPRERKLVRVAAVAPRGETDRIWRVTVKPVAGPVTASGSALKLLLGYDALVILRPRTLRSAITGQHVGDTLTLQNDGNTNAELYEGKLCQSNGESCSPLPSRRLYPGQSWSQPASRSARITYRIATAGKSEEKSF
ncbi:hypothetical protein [Sphingobium sp.]|uniref:hypothetical protein n=1 Tax=Sphingobium sp. TaxID=1912891 RepID=UPI003B3AB39C